MNSNKNIRCIGVGRAILLMLLLSTTGLLTYGQLSVPGSPPSIKNNISISDLPVETMRPIDITEIEQQDAQDEAAGMPPRFGYPLPVALDLTSAGTWMELADGSRVWRLRISAPGAKSINLLYDDFYMPVGGQMYVYNTKLTQVIGAFTDRNNKQGGDFATGLVYGDEIVVEYVEPAAVRGQGRVSLQYVVHGYRYIPDFNIETDEAFGDSGPCQVNVNCSEGSAWQDEKKGVALIVVGGTRWCSGSLIRTTGDNCTPYFLTAHHCLSGFVGTWDAVTAPNANTWSFYWNYESPGCADGSDFTPPSTNGATVVANDAPSDFALLLLTEDPADDPAIDIYYNGWDRRTSFGSGGVGIHHPSGDIKKIATHSMTPLFDDWFGTSPSTSHWRVNWDATANGHSVTEGGSSGSPLFSPGSRIVGMLHGGSAINCSDPANDPGIYGAMSYGWDNGGATDNRRRLRPWLDDAGTGALTLNGTTGCGFACPPTLSLTGTFTSGTYFGQASNTITSIADLSGTSVTTYRAGNSITLLEGFSAGFTGSAGLFSAEISPCTSATPPADTYREEDNSLEPIVEGNVTVYPNPFTDFTNVSFELTEKGLVDVAVLDINGKIVAQLVASETLAAGTHNHQWNSTDAPQGTYILRTIIGGELTTSVLTVIR